MKMNKIAAALGAVATLGYGATAFAIPSPGAVADAYLRVSNFTILQGNGAATKSNNPLTIVTSASAAGVRINSVQTNADTLADINGTTDSDSTSVGLGVPFAISSTVGAGFVANTLLTGDPTSTYAGAATSSNGNALNPLTPDDVPVHTQVSIVDFNTVGSAQSNQNLLTSFTVTVTGAPVTFELNFDADGFLRAALGQDNVSANAAYNWSATVRQGASTVLRWTPDGATGGFSGSCVAASTCTEYADAFGMNDNIGALVTEDNVIDQAMGTFDMELTLTAGTYQFTINHNTSADAEVGSVPEPGTLALLGAALLGVGARRRKTA